MLLQPGSIELGLQRSEITKFHLRAGEMIVCHRHADYWIRFHDVQWLTLSISDAALNAA
jgi:hypothetical protein